MHYENIVLSNEICHAPDDLYSIFNEGLILDVQQWLNKVKHNQKNGKD